MTSVAIVSRVPGVRYLIARYHFCVRVAWRRNMRAKGPVAKRWYGSWAVWRGYLLGVLGIVFITLVALPSRDRLNTVTIALSYLVIVLASATIGGLGPGIFVS